MAFKKDDPNINRAGRSGPNKATTQIKEAFAMLLDENLESMSAWLISVSHEDPKAALEIMIKLSERFVPKLSQQALTNEDGSDIFKNVAFNFGPPVDSDERDQTELNE
tara:strand:+ start:1811 stop:2134 length:324 start_codon:yes stop_codon:yes gene_type:complete